MWVNGFGTKSVIWIHVRKMNQVFVHINVPNSIMKLIGIKSTLGCHTSIVVSGLHSISYIVWYRDCEKFGFSSFFFFQDDPCELYCTDSADTLIVPWGDMAADGTPCNIGTNDMCISGICRVS